MELKNIKIAVTGANSYIGYHLIKYSLENGVTIRALTRKTVDSEFKPIVENKGTYESAYFDLESGCNSSTLEGVDVLVHLAWYRPDKTRLKNDKELNYYGTKRLLELARSSGIKKTIFLSSQLSSPTTFSFYAKNKYRVEELFDQPGDLIIRVGYVFGEFPLGFYKQTLEKIGKTKIIPIAGPNALINPINVKDLIDIVLKLSIDDGENLKRIYSVGSEKAITLREFVKYLSRIYFRKEIHTISLPVLPLYFGMWFFSFFNPQANDLSERLGGILSTKRMNTRSCLRNLGIVLSETETFIKNGATRGLAAEGCAFSQYLFKDKYESLVQEYVELIQSYPYSTPLPLPRVFIIFPSLIALIEPISFFKKNGLMRIFQKRLLLLVALRQRDISTCSHTANIRRGGVLSLITSMFLLLGKEVVFIPFRALHHGYVLLRKGYYE
jgi:nucleoside-diphosphate-sugar epimerase